MCCRADTLQSRPPCCSNHLQGSDGGRDGGSSSYLRRLAALKQPRYGVEQLLRLHWLQSRAFSANI